MTEPAPASPKGAVTVTELTRAGQQLARRMAESRAIVPDWTLGLNVDLTAAQAACQAAQAGPGDAVARALGLALRAHPKLNGAYRDAKLEAYARVNVAVAVPTPDGLAFPTLLDADRTPLAALAARRAELEARVAAGALTQPEQAGATATLHDLGAGPAATVTPVLTPTQALAVGLGAVAVRPVVRDGALTTALTAHLTLACDARLVLPADATAFATTLLALLEDASGL